MNCPKCSEPMEIINEVPHKLWKCGTDDCHTIAQQLPDGELALLDSLLTMVNLRDDRIVAATSKPKVVYAPNLIEGREKTRAIILQALNEDQLEVHNIALRSINRTSPVIEYLRERAIIDERAKALADGLEEVRDMWSLSTRNRGLPGEGP